MRRADSDPDKYSQDTMQHMKIDTASSDEADMMERRPTRPERKDRSALRKALEAARDEGEYTVHFDLHSYVIFIRTQEPQLEDHVVAPLHEGEIVEGTTPDDRTMEHIRYAAPVKDIKVVQLQLHADAEPSTADLMAMQKVAARSVCNLSSL